MTAMTYWASVRASERTNDTRTETKESSNGAPSGAAGSGDDIAQIVVADVHRLNGLASARCKQQKEQDRQ